MEKDVKDTFDKVRQSFVNIGSDMKALNEVVTQSSSALKAQDRLIQNLNEIMQDLEKRINRIENSISNESENADEVESEEEQMPSVVNRKEERISRRRQESEPEPEQEEEDNDDDFYPKPRKRVR